jgi:hypothetical protein
MTPAPAAGTAVPRQGVPLIDGVEKVTGRAAYTADLDPAGALIGRIFRSPVSHGEIVRLDVTNARALDGVFAVLTGEDCPHTYGVLPVAMNEYPLARGRVRYRGEPVPQSPPLTPRPHSAHWTSSNSRCVSFQPITAPLRPARRTQCCFTTTSRATSSAKSITPSAT